jgi:thioredoxin-like negative regulator of GroEL
MSQLAGGDAQEARKTLHRILMQDPHYAKAHFRMGEIALFNRNLNYASTELNLALNDTDRLDSREQTLTRISLAIAVHDRHEISRLSDEISQRWPDDPDFSRMRDTFPGMFLELPRQGGRRRLRP